MSELPRQTDFIGLSTTGYYAETSIIRQRMHPQTATMGRDAEAAACRELQRNGYRILDRNWRRPWGELDVVAERAGVIHFIEVKGSLRRTDGFEPYLRADGLKMTKVRRTARTWLAAHSMTEDTEWQMDVVSVIMGLSEPEFEYFENI